jgi:tripartite-type tricarboxylate transporter receptor subunit TctC
MINPEFPAKNLQELIGVLRADPGKYSFASAGIGTTPHLSGELFKLSAGVDIVHVPFNGGSPAVQSVVAGHTPIGFTALPPAAPLVKAGQLRAVAVTGKTRSPALPEVPTMAEAGFPNQEADTMQGVLAPARTPKPILDLLHREIAKIVHEPDVQEKIAALGFAAVGNSPEEFSAHIKAEIAKWAQVIKQANIHIE